MNLLSIGAAFGVHRRRVPVGLGRQPDRRRAAGPIEAWVPMMLFAILFGLSMDYEVFLLTRIREEYDRTGDNGPPWPTAWPSPPGSSPPRRAIMVCVFGSFVLGDDRRSSCSASAWPSPSSSTPRSSAWCWCRPRWSCWRPELVVAPLARPDPAHRPRRGRRRGGRGPALTAVAPPHRPDPRAPAGLTGHVRARAWWRARRAACT